MADNETNTQRTARGVGEIAARMRQRHAEANERDAAKAEELSGLKRRLVDRVREDGTVEPVAYTDEQYDAAFASARAAISEQYRTTKQRKGAMRYLGVCALVTALGLGSIFHMNKRFAPEYYDRAYADGIAEALDNGRNYGVFDLNIDIRNLRDAQIARLDRTPDVVLLGASHWQEADVALVTDRRMFNAHIHRDYYEDPLAMIQMLESHERLPDTLILNIRDNQFTPVAARTDFLWLPGIPFYRKMARKLGLKAHHPVEVAPVQHWRDRLSLDVLHANVKRRLEAPVQPGPTDATKTESLDLLLPGGSIVWSHEHDRVFTRARARKEALDFAAAKRNAPPIIDPKGVEATEKLLEYLHSKGVRVYLSHPPFNPLYWEAVQGSPYIAGLEKVKNLTKGWADRFGWEVIGGFDPTPFGCTADQYIDAEHANRDCLRAVFDQFVDLDRAHHGKPPLVRDAKDAPEKAPAEPAVEPLTEPNGANVPMAAAEPVPMPEVKIEVAADAPPLTPATQVAEYVLVQPDENQPREPGRLPRLSAADLPVSYSLRLGLSATLD